MTPAALHGLRKQIGNYACTRLAGALASLDVGEISRWTAILNAVRACDPHEGATDDEIAVVCRRYEGLLRGDL